METFLKILQNWKELLKNTTDRDMVRKLQTNFPHKYRCRSPQWNTSKLNPMALKGLFFFPVQNRKNDPKIHMELQEPYIARTVLKRKNKVEGFTLLNFKTDCGGGVSTDI